jgi:hypothetical protein
MNASSASRRGIRRVHWHRFPQRYRAFQLLAVIVMMIVMMPAIMATESHGNSGVIHVAIVAPLLDYHRGVPAIVPVVMMMVITIMVVVRLSRRGDSHGADGHNTCDKFVKDSHVTYFLRLAAGKS